MIAVSYTSAFQWQRPCSLCLERSKPFVPLKSSRVRIPFVTQLSVLVFLRKYILPSRNMLSWKLTDLSKLSREEKQKVGYTKEGADLLSSGWLTKTWIDLYRRSPITSQWTLICTKTQTFFITPQEARFRVCLCRIFSVCDCGNWGKLICAHTFVQGMAFWNYQPEQRTKCK